MRGGVYRKGLGAHMRGGVHRKGLGACTRTQYTLTKQVVNSSKSCISPQVKFHGLNLWLRPAGTV